MVVHVWLSTWINHLHTNGINPAYPDQATPAVKGDFDKIEKQLFQCKLEQDMIFHFQRMQTKHNLYYLLCLFPIFWSKSTFNRNMEQYDCRAGVALGQGKKHSRSY
jgi:hypothetical protein